VILQNKTINGYHFFLYFMNLDIHHFTIKKSFMFIIIIYENKNCISLIIIINIINIVLWKFKKRINNNVVIIHMIRRFSQWNTTKIKIKIMIDIIMINIILSNNNTRNINIINRIFKKTIKIIFFRYSWNGR